MTNEVKETIDFIDGHLIYSKGASEVLAIRADHISGIKYKNDAADATVITIDAGDIKQRLDFGAHAVEDIQIIANNDVNLQLLCTRELFDKILEGIFNLYNNKTTPTIELN